MLNVPFAIADATTLTEVGYVGDDAESIIQKLLRSCNFDTKKAAKGIVYIDEIDKIAYRKVGSHTKDVSGDAVQQDLLKLIEGTMANISLYGKNKEECCRVDTGNILFICGGAFPELDKTIKERIEKQNIGFTAQIYDEKDKKAVSELMRKVKPDDLIKYGFIPEFIGRLPVIAVLDEITKDEMVRILKEPKNSLIKQYQELFHMDNADIEFEDEVLKIIAQRAIEEKTGARGLRSILENILLDMMYDLPSQTKQGKITIGREFLNDNPKNGSCEQL
jgi:ATP-dependent Clp protease ATP-binding subunit ClpX